MNKSFLQILESLFLYTLPTPVQQNIMEEQQQTIEILTSSSQGDDRQSEAQQLFNNQHQPNKLLNMYLGLNSNERMTDNNMGDEEDDDQFEGEEDLEEWNLGSSLSQNRHLIAGAKHSGMIKKLQAAAGGGIIERYSEPTMTNITEGDMLLYSQDCRPNNDQNPSEKIIPMTNPQSLNKNPSMLIQGQIPQLSIQSESGYKLQTKTTAVTNPESIQASAYRLQQTTNSSTNSIKAPASKAPSKQVPQPKLIKSYFGMKSQKSFHSPTRAIEAAMNLTKPQQNNNVNSKSMISAAPGGSSSLKKVESTSRLFGSGTKPVANFSFTAASSAVKQSSNQAHLNMVIQKYSQQQQSQKVVALQGPPTQRMTAPGSSMAQPKLGSSSMIMNNHNSSSLAYHATALGINNSNQGSNTMKSTHSSFAGKKFSLIAAGASPKHSPPATCKIDLAEDNNSQLLWREVLRFLSVWHISPPEIKANGGYFSRKEVADILLTVEKKVIKELQKQLQLQHKREEELTRKLKTTKQQASKECNDGQEQKWQEKYDEMMSQMKACEEQLRQSMLNSLMCLDFYRDLEQYIQDHRYQTESAEVRKHLEAIDQLVQQHGLNALDFETEKINALVETIRDYGHGLTLDRRLVHINCAPDDSQVVDCNNGMRVTVAKVNKQVTPFNMSSQMDTSNRSGSYNNRHVGSTCNQHGSGGFSTNKMTTASEELKVKNAIIAKLRVQLEHRMKQALELKQKLRQEADEQHQKYKLNQLKEALINLEKEFNVVVVRNTKLTLESKQLVRERDELQVEMAKVRAQCREAVRDAEELRLVINSDEGYRQLQETVVQLTGIMVSKRNEQLNGQQRQQLKSIFGNSPVLQSLRYRILTLQEQLTAATQFIVKSLGVGIQQQEVIEQIWSFITKVYQIANNNSEDIQPILKLLLQNQWRDEESVSSYYQKEIKSRATYLKQLRKDVQKINSIDLIVQEQWQEEQLDIVTSKSSGKNIQKSPNNLKGFWNIYNDNISESKQEQRRKIICDNRMIFQNQNIIQQPSRKTVNEYIIRQENEEDKEEEEDLSLLKFEEIHFQKHFKDLFEESQDPTKKPTKLMLPNETELVIKLTENSFQRTQNKIVEGFNDVISKISRNEDLSDLNSITRVTSGEDQTKNNKVSKKMLKEKIKKLRQSNQELVQSIKMLQRVITQLKGVGPTCHSQFRDDLGAQSNTIESQQFDIGNSKNESLIEKEQKEVVSQSIKNAELENASEAKMMDKDLVYMLMLQAEALENALLKERGAQYQ